MPVSEYILWLMLGLIYVVGFGGFLIFIIMHFMYLWFGIGPGTFASMDRDEWKRKMPKHHRNRK